MTTIVLFGGSSDERHVSVASAQNILRVLPNALAWFWSPEGMLYDVAVSDVLAQQRPFEIDFVPARPAIFPSIEQALDTLPVEDPVLLLALHGTGGEDGTLQEMLETRGIPFTGSGSVASAAAFDKEHAKSIVQDRVRVAESRVARTATELHGAIDDMLSRHERVVLKPVAGGSSRGLLFLERDRGRPDLAGINIPYIVEQFIDGRELSVGVIDQGSGPFALPVIEIEVDPGASFDYDGKYLGAKSSREICPAHIPDGMARDAQAAALTAHITLRCRGYSRTDIIAANDGIYFLEINTLPGLSAASLVPQELREAGIPFREFLERQVAGAQRHQDALQERTSLRF